jgi:glycosyltransferase involved in cell wall biosynthesis
MSEARLRRVAFVSDSMPERNGVGAYYTDLVEQLDPARFQTLFLCPGRTRSLLRMPLPGDRTQALVLPPPMRIARELREFAPDVIVAATPGPWGLLGVRWARRLSARLIVGFHTDYAGVTDLYGRSLFKRLSRGYFRRVDRLMFERADHVLGNSMAMIEQAERMGARKASRIGTLVPRKMVETPPAPLPTRLARVLFAGRLAPEKRIDTVLDAAAQLPELEFAIAGDGPLRAEVEQAAARLPNLRYLGWQDRDGLCDELDRSDALVLPSEFESFGTVALEAMARGRLALVTSTCGIVNWSQLRDGLVVFELDRPLTEVLREVRDWPAERMQAQSRAARSAAVELNRASLAQWAALLDPSDAPSDNEGATP